MLMQGAAWQMVVMRQSSGYQDGPPRVRDKWATVVDWAR